MWNMQSGKERRSFALSGAAPGDSKAKIISASKFAKPQDADKVKAKAPIRSTKAITGLVTDALNTVVVASTLEGKLYVSARRQQGRLAINCSSLTSTTRNCCTRCSFRLQLRRWI